MLLWVPKPSSKNIFFTFAFASYMHKLLPPDGSTAASSNFLAQTTPFYSVYIKKHSKLLLFSLLYSRFFYWITTLLISKGAERNFLEPLGENKNYLKEQDVDFIKDTFVILNTNSTKTKNGALNMEIENILLTNLFFFDDFKWLDDKVTRLVVSDTAIHGSSVHSDL